MGEFKMLRNALNTSGILDFLARLNPSLFQKLGQKENLNQIIDEKLSQLIESLNLIRTSISKVDLNQNLKELDFNGIEYDSTFKLDELIINALKLVFSLLDLVGIDKVELLSRITDED